MDKNLLSTSTSLENIEPEVLKSRLRKTQKLYEKLLHDRKEERDREHREHREQVAKMEEAIESKNKQLELLKTKTKELLAKFRNGPQEDSSETTQKLTQQNIQLEKDLMAYRSELERRERELDQAKKDNAVLQKELQSLKSQIQLGTRILRNSAEEIRAAMHPSVDKKRTNSLKESYVPRSYLPKLIEEKNERSESFGHVLDLHENSDINNIKEQIDIYENMTLELQRALSPLGPTLQIKPRISSDHIVKKHALTRMYSSLENTESLSYNIRILHKSITQNKIKHFVLRKVHLDDDSFIPLLRAMANNKSVREVCFENMKLSAPVLTDLTTLFSLNSTISSFEANSCSINTPSLLQIVTALANNKNVNIESFTLTNNPLDQNLEKPLVSILAIRSLVHLTLDGCNLGENGGLVLSKALESQQGLKIKHLNLRENAIGDSALLALLNSLSHCPQLEIINLSNNGLSDTAAPLMESVLKSLKCLKSLNLSFNHLTSRGLEELIPGLTHSGTALQELDLTNNPLGKMGGKQISTLLKNSKSLVVLKLWACQLDHQGLYSIAQALSTTPTTLKELELRSNVDWSSDSIYDIGKAFGTIFEKNSNLGLSILDLATNQLTPDTIGNFSLFLPQVKNLVEIRLNGNEFRDAGVKQIANGLKQNFSVRILNLSLNLISSDGAQYLADLLQTNRHLQVLDLSWNHISTSGARALAFELSQASEVGLIDLNLEGNDIGEEGAKFFGQCLETNGSMARLNLSANQILASGARALASGLRKNKMISELSLKENRIGSEGAIRVAEAIKATPVLTYIDLSYNKISSEESAQALSEAITLNTSISTVLVAGNPILASLQKRDFNASGRFIYLA